LPVRSDDGGHHCPQHGPVPVLWRPTTVDYHALAEVINRTPELPTYLPWPMSPGWSIADFGCVSTGSGGATVTTTAGSSDLDGDVTMTVVAEDPGNGLGARVAGVADVDPGDQGGGGVPAVRVRAAGRQVPMWAVDTVADTDPLVRAVFAGEAEGRWLWIVLRPASAALLLQDEWLLADVAGFGPEALEMPFGGPRPEW
jgi:hypothetical protein